MSVPKRIHKIFWGTWDYKVQNVSLQHYDCASVHICTNRKIQVKIKKDVVKLSALNTSSLTGVTFGVIPAGFSQTHFPFGDFFFI